MPAEHSRSGQHVPLDSPKALGEAIRGTRRRHGMTQTRLAGLAGTGLRFISELERGKPGVALDKVLAVLAVLGLRLQIAGDEP